MKAGYAKLQGLPSNGVSQLHTYDHDLDRIIAHWLTNANVLSFFFPLQIPHVGAHTDTKEWMRKR